MKQTKDLMDLDAARKKESRRESGNSIPAHVERAMLVFWSRMIDIRGEDYWVKKYGDIDGQAFQTWCRILKDLSKEELAHGIMKYYDSGKPFIDPITLKGYCKIEKPKALHKLLPKHLQLPSGTWEERQDKAKSELAKIRAKLNAT